MSAMMSSPQGAQQWGERQHRPENLRRYQHNRSGVSPGLLVAGLAALGVGAFLAYTLGPDLVRYLKIERM
jgi:hypothetical protein